MLRLQHVRNCVHIFEAILDWVGHHSPRPQYTATAFYTQQIPCSGMNLLTMRLPDGAQFVHA